MRRILTFSFSVFLIMLNAQTFTELPQSPPIIGLSSPAIALADIDGDNDKDLVITGRDAGNPSATHFSKLYANDGAGNFSEVADTPFPASYFGSIAFADIDNDGDQDVLITGRDTVERIAKLFTNNGTGQFTEVTDTPFDGVWVSSVAFEDVDGDNDRDVLIMGFNNDIVRISKLYLNDGTGVFSEKTDVELQGALRGDVGFADIDNDSDQDLAIMGESGVVAAATKLYTNDGLGNFTEVTETGFPNIAYGSFDFSDVDGDGDQDFILTGEIPGAIGEKITELYANDGSGNFLVIDEVPFIPVSLSYVSFVDIDNDGDQDLFFTGSADGGIKVKNIYLNNGTGEFVELEGLPFNENDSFGTFALTDVNGDEKIDLIVTGRFENEYFTKVFINEGLMPSLNFSSTRFNLKVKTFPNPASGDKLNVNFDVEHGGESIIRIFGANGHLVTQHQEFTTRGKQTILVDISGLAAGSYFLQVETGNRNGFVEVVVQ